MKEKHPDQRERTGNTLTGQVRLRPLIELLDGQGDSMRTLFANALNLDVSRGVEAMLAREKRDWLDTSGPAPHLTHVRSPKPQVPLTE